MLSDQTNSCPHQVHGVLVFECTAWSLCLFVVRNNSSCPFFVWKQNGQVTLNIPFLCLVCLHWFCTVAQIVFEHFERYRCFSYISLFVFCCKCCKTVHETVYNLSRQPFLGRLECRARFCKGFAVLTFLIHACCSYYLNNKTCCWQMFDFQCPSM